MTQQELERDLGIEGLTQETCFAGLFADLFEDVPHDPDAPEPEEPAEPEVFKVTQMGPGRRDARTKKGADDGDAPAT